MTTVVWYKGLLVADKKVSDGNYQTSVTKIRRAGNELVAVAGGWDKAQVLFQWVAKGRKERDYPEFQDTEAWVDLLVIDKDGQAWLYNRHSVPMKIEKLPFVMGSGGNYAAGALAAGATPQEAVEIASRFDPSTGFGMDVLKYVSPTKFAIKPRKTRG
jgi:ATP-dependent protease HslVU (ClpYQ) peptidase subunit